MEEVSKSALQLNLPQNSNPTDSVSKKIHTYVIAYCMMIYILCIHNEKKIFL